MSSDKKQDEETGAQEPRSDEIPGEGRTADQRREDGIEDAEVLGETVADGSRFDHDAPSDDTLDGPRDDIAETSFGDTTDMPFGEDDPDGVRRDDDALSVDGASADGTPGAETTADGTVGDDPATEGAYRTSGMPSVARLSDADAGPGATTEPAPATPPVAPPPQQPRAKSGGGFMPALLGGVIAAGLGFAAAQYDVAGMLGMEAGPDPVAEGLSEQNTRLSELETQIASLAETLSAPDTGGADQIAAQLGELSQTLGAQLDDVAGSVGTVRDDLGGAISGVTTQLNTVGTGLDEIETRLDTVTERLTAVERRPLTESSEAAQAAFSAYDRDIAALREQLSQQQDQNADLTAQLTAANEKAQSDAAAAEARLADLQSLADAKAARIAAQADLLARKAETREALASLDSAIYQGQPFEDALAKLSDKGTIPAPLSNAAGTGVASLPELRESFAPAARQALDASIRNTVGDEPTSRLTAFVRAQTGLRSLAPRDGDDPDAVLSRADAAVEAGDLETAISELEALPEPGRAAMADWVAKAESRLAVTQAAASLADTLPAN